jgi:hypothetical protein
MDIAILLFPAAVMTPLALLAWDVLGRGRSPAPSHQRG